MAATPQIAIAVLISVRTQSGNLPSASAIPPRTTVLLNFQRSGLVPDRREAPISFQLAAKQ